MTTYSRIPLNQLVKQVAIYTEFDLRENRDFFDSTDCYAAQKDIYEKPLTPWYFHRKTTQQMAGLIGKHERTLSRYAKKYKKYLIDHKVLIEDLAGRYWWNPSMWYVMDFMNWPRKAGSGEESAISAMDILDIMSDALVDDE